jgi:hypothetical protein
MWVGCSDCSSIGKGAQTRLERPTPQQHVEVGCFAAFRPRFPPVAAMSMEGKFGPPRASDGLHSQLESAVASTQIPLRVRLAGWEAGIVARCTFLPFLDCAMIPGGMSNKAVVEARASNRVVVAVEWWCQAKSSQVVKSSQGPRLKNRGERKCRGPILHIDERRGRVCSGVAIKSSLPFPVPESTVHLVSHRRSRGPDAVECRPNGQMSWALHRDTKCHRSPPSPGRPHLTPAIQGGPTRAVQRHGPSRDIRQ